MGAEAPLQIVQNICLYPLSLVEYSLYWWGCFLPILLVVTSSTTCTVVHICSLTCRSGHSDNEISFDSKVNFGLSFLLNYCSIDHTHHLVNSQWGLCGKFALGFNPNTFVIPVPLQCLRWAVSLTCLLKNWQLKFSLLIALQDSVKFPYSK